MKLTKLVIVVSIFISACATPTSANYEKILNSWVGSNVDDLVLKWGPPASTYTLSNGDRIFQFVANRNVQTGGYTTTVPQTSYESGTANIYGAGGSVNGTYSGTSTTYVQETTPVWNITKTCITRFVTDQHGIVTKWSWQGNDCKAFEPK